jgi:uncharacterized membrane protein
VHRIRERIEIDAPVEAVWKVVHRDIAKVPRWSKNLLRTEVVGGGSLRVGSELLYVVKLPGGLTHDLHLKVLEYDELRRCSGSMEASSMSGTFRWTYRARGDVTVVTYETDVTVTGMLRFAGRIVVDQVRRDVRSNVEALKEYVEGRRRR